MQAVEFDPAALKGILIHLSRERRALVQELRKLGDAAALATKQSEQAFARAFMGAEGQSMDLRRQIAILAAIEARYLADLADRSVVACKAAIETLRDDIGIARTLSATTRDELKTLGVEE